LPQSSVCGRRHYRVIGDRGEDVSNEEHREGGAEPSPAIGGGAIALSLIDTLINKRVLTQGRQAETLASSSLGSRSA